VAAAVFGTIARAVAKKVRTPPPPRRHVQAPQRRDTKRPKGAPERGSRRLLWFVAALALIAAAAIGSALYFALRSNGGTSSQSAPNYNTLPGIRRTKPPWPVDAAHLDENLARLGLDTTESHLGLALHVHDHLDIWVNGKKVTVPALIGIGPGYSYLAELHTHYPDGMIHVESTDAGKHFILGQFFGEWEVFLNSNCIGSYCGLKWYVNGKRETGNPAHLPLKAHLEIAIVVGKPPRKIPATYAWGGL
jgi:hypothetical protein